MQCIKNQLYVDVKKLRLYVSNISGLTYYNYYYRNSTLENYWNYMQDTISRECHYNPYPIKDIIDTWITQRYFPVLEVIRDDVSNITEVTIAAHYSQSEQKDNNKINNKNKNKWYIPFTYVTQSNPNFAQLFCHAVLWLTPEKEKVVITGIPAHDWIILNSQQTGKFSTINILCLVYITADKDE